MPTPDGRTCSVVVAGTTVAWDRTKRGADDVRGTRRM